MVTNAVPREAVLIYNNALELSGKGDLDSALKEYQRAISVYPDFVAAYNNIGEIFTRMGESEKAITSYLEALKIDKHYRVLLNLGVEHFNRKNYKDALKYFSESLSREPQFIEGNFYTGLVYYNQNNYKKSEKYFQKTIKADIKHLKANYLLAHIYYEWQEYPKVIECLDRIREITDDKSFINRFYGFCYFYLGQYDDAVKYLKREVSRGVRYDGIILDPPKFGRGPKGELWEFYKLLPTLLELCRQVLSQHPLFLILTAYAVKASSLTLYNAVHSVMSTFKGSTTYGELVLKESSAGRNISTAVYSQWSAE